jgi:hypothetical protein
VIEKSFTQVYINIQNCNLSRERGAMERPTTRQYPDIPGELIDYGF